MSRFVPCQKFFQLFSNCFHNSLEKEDCVPKKIQILAFNFHNLFYTLCFHSQELGRQETHTMKNFSHIECRKFWYQNTIVFIFLGPDCSVFIITSTTGNGEPPHHAIGFKGVIEDALKNEKQILKGLKYAVFGLGSSIYENFCTFGKFCNSSIEALGKVPLIKSFFW